MQSNVLTQCENWLRQQVNNSGASGIILGLSGGIDSSVLAALAREALGKNGVLGVIMPCHSIQEDEADAKLLAEEIDIDFKRVDLSGIYDLMLVTLGEEISKLAKTNLKARLRMLTLYALGQTKNLLVCGTSNKSEYETGYFTKYGDSGVDLMPLANFLKREIRELAKILGVPEKIINKAPSAGLYQGQTDESDMGFTYEILDEYLATGKIQDLQAKERIDVMHRRSEHKRQPIPIFKF